MATGTRDTAALRARRKDELLEKMLGAIDRLHHEGIGFAEASVETLISEAGVSRSTFYSYFEDKDALLRELAGATCDELLELWIENVPGGASKNQLRSAIRKIIAAYTPRRAIMIAAGNAPAGSATARQFEALVERSADVLAAQIKTAQAEGRSPKELDARTTAMLLMWTGERGLAMGVSGTEPDQVDELADSLNEVYWRTLRLDS